MGEQTVLHGGVGASLARTSGQRACARRPGHVLTALLGLGLAWLTPGAAEACYCAAAELESSIDAADVIFEGMTAGDPDAIEQDIGLGLYGDVHTRRYDFEVLRYFKADGGVALPPEVALHTPAQAPACGRTFDKSQVYLIYARLREDGLLVDFRCSRTRSFDHAGEDLRVLGDGVAPDEGADVVLGVFDAEGPVGTPSLDGIGTDGDANLDAGLAGGCSQARAAGGATGSLALLSFGAGAALLRRRREHNVTA